MSEMKDTSGEQQAANGPAIVAVCRRHSHSFSKDTQPSIKLVMGAHAGVEGDGHAGETEQHLHRLPKNADSPNLRQVHLIHQELHEELRGKGFDVSPGDMGENVTTAGLNLLGLPTGAILTLGSTAQIRVTGLRNPCPQLNRFKRGLMSKVVEKAADGSLVRKCGIMAVVSTEGVVQPGDAITVALPEQPWTPLGLV